MVEDWANAPLRILVVEDDAVVRELLEMLLPMEGHGVISAATGSEGVALLESEPGGVNVVLSDLQLPDLSAAELLAAFRAAAAPGTLLLAMSATKPKGSEAEGFDGFLLKPFQPGDVTAAVAAARLQRDEAMQTVAAGAGEEVDTVGEEDVLECDAADLAAVPALDEGIFGTMSATLPPGQLLELYAMTLEDVAQRVERMGTALARGDQEQYRREAHAIKGGCGMVGAVELRDLAAAAEGGSPESTPPLEEFTRACARLRRMLNVRLA